MKHLHHFRIFVFTTIFIIAGGSVKAQQDSSKVKTARNSLFIEFGGNASGPGQSWTKGRWWLRYSINYDWIFHETAIAKFSLRIASNFPFPRESHNIPLMINLLVGKKAFLFEFGVGAEIIFFNSDYTIAHGALTSVLGLRYQKHAGGIMARIGITPTLGTDDGTELYVGSIAGASLGYSF